MRFRLELLIASTLVVLAYGVPRHVAADGVKWKCGGETNCASDNCITQPGAGFSCAMVAAIDHPKCLFTGDEDDSCENMSVECALLEYYGGGPCEGNPAKCFGEPVGPTDLVEEDGCVVDDDP